MRVVASSVLSAPLLSAGAEDLAMPALLRLALAELGPQRVVSA